MFVVYPAIFIKEKESYTVLFPDFGGATCGKSIEDAYYMSTDYLGMNLLDYYKGNKEFHIFLPRSAFHSSVFMTH